MCFWRKHTLALCRTIPAPLVRLQVFLLAEGLALSVQNTTRRHPAPLPLAGGGQEGVKDSHSISSGFTSPVRG